MKILFAASEVAPFIKTGGLADVAGSLPAALAALGHEVKVILPLYEGISQQWRDQMTFLRHDQVQLSWRNCYCGLFSLEKDGVTYLFVDNQYYFNRHDIYGHYDDGERFGFFSRAVVETPVHLDWEPDIIHCNDWETALVPIYLLEERKLHPQLANAKSVFTIHNIEYQGRYGEQVLDDLYGLPRAYFNEEMLAHYGDVNLMKGAIIASDYVTTVSPTYAAELRYPFYAHGLEGVITACQSKFCGVLNGIDVKLYNPNVDHGLAKTYSAKRMAGKAACKAALQRLSGLREDPYVPLIACVSRLVAHKGYDLVIAGLQRIMDMDVQMVVLGTGDWKYEETFRHAAAQYPARFAAHLVYSTTLSAPVYGGADFLLMPSISEPCGLSQMIAMRYGTVPIVRKTGGLSDTVLSWDPDTRTGTGFTFVSINVEDMLDAVNRAVTTCKEDPDSMRDIRKNGMTADFSWKSSAKAYLDIYDALIDR